MAIIKLTKAVKEHIAKNAVMDLFVPSLRKCWGHIEAQFTELVKDAFKDFDWEHVEPYRKYINWHTEIRLSSLPGDWQICWDEFRKVCELPSIDYVCVSFAYPSRDTISDYLDSAFQDRAKDILRPYVVEYFTARKYYEDINQILLGISTYKQLEAIVPELTRYAPRIETEAVAALVPIEQINRVRNVLQREAI